MTAAEQLLLPTPAARPCPHPRANHQHGTLQAYKQDKCKCGPCRDASTAYERHRSQQKAYGRWQPYADAQPVREHVEALVRSGDIGWKDIARRAGVSVPTVRALLYGRGRAKRTVLRVLLSTAEGLTAVTTGTRTETTGEPVLLRREAIG